MWKLINLNLNIRVLSLFLGFFLIARPAYSIPTSIDELKESIGGMCAEFGMQFCASEPKKDEQKKGPRKFTETEQQILTRLAEQQDRLKLREMELDRREGQLKTFQEDIHRQISQLEKLQKNIERDIESKKAQDDKQLDKAVAFYSKMTPATAAESISKLDRKIAVSILKRMKEKQASLVLSSMGAEESASIIAEIAKK